MSDRPTESTRERDRGGVVGNGSAGCPTRHGADPPVTPAPDRSRRARDAVIHGSPSPPHPSDGIDERTATGRDALGAHLDIHGFVAGADAEPPLACADEDTVRDRTGTLDATEAVS
jgi:hypothetical protein